MIKTTLNEKEGVYFLLKNGRASVCPYRNPIMAQSQFKPGSIEYIDIPCSSLCPLFTLHKKTEGIESGTALFAQISCSNDYQHRILIDEFTTESKLTSI